MKKKNNVLFLIKHTPGLFNNCLYIYFADFLEGYISVYSCKNFSLSKQVAYQIRRVDYLLWDIQIISLHIKLNKYLLITFLLISIDCENETKKDVKHQSLWNIRDKQIFEALLSKNIM